MLTNTTEGAGPNDPAEALHFLQIYEADHRAAAEGGITLVRRVKDSNEGTELGRALTELERQLAEEIEEVERVLTAFGGRRDRLKELGAGVAVHVGRFKPNGRFLSYSPLSRVLELEALIGAVSAKQQGWRTLRLLADHDRRLDTETFDRLIERADAQREMLIGHHAEAAGVAFGPATTGADDR